MSISDVFKIVGRFEEAEHGRSIYKEILSRYKTSEVGFALEVQALSEEEFSSFVTYQSYQSLDMCNYTDEAIAKILPSSLKNTRVNMMKTFARKESS